MSHDDIYAVSLVIAWRQLKTAWMLFLKEIHTQKSKTTFSILPRDKLAINSTFTQLKM